MAPSLAYGSPSSRLLGCSHMTPLGSELPHFQTQDVSTPLVLLLPQTVLLNGVQVPFSGKCCVEPTVYALGVQAALGMPCKQL